MKMKDIPFDGKPSIMTLTEDSKGEIRLAVNTNAGLRIFSFQAATIEDLTPPGVTLEQLGPPIHGLLMNSNMVACYTSTHA